MQCAQAVTFYAALSSGGAVTRQYTAVMPVGLAGVDSCAAGQWELRSTAEINSNVTPWNLTLAEGGAISSAVVLLWAVGFGIRMIIRTIREGSPIDNATE